MHSGLLFLFPHYYKVVQAAERCHHTMFDARANMWFNPAIPSSNISSEIPCDVMPGEVPSFVTLYLEIVASALIFGAGTAVGEIPPYYFSYMASKAGEENEEFDEIMGEVRCLSFFLLSGSRQTRLTPSSFDLSPVPV